MSLYGALYSGVSGLKAQGSKIGIISDNISNVNTVGYKGGSAQFSTLVTGSSSVVSYSPGGVKASNRQLVDKQGLLLTTDSPTDIAISGNGFFAVNSKADGSEQPLYTRAGSFRQDNLGNFVNANGFFLQGWPLDREGRLPGEPGNLNTTSFANLDSLQTVNVQSVSGVAASTTAIEVGANLDAGETVYPGAGSTADMDANNTANFGINAQSIIASSEFGLAPANSITRGDRMTVTTGSGLSYTYQYGGYAIGRDVTNGNVGDGGTAFPTVLAAGSFNSALGSATVTVTVAGGHGFGPVGSTRTIDVSGIVAGDVAGRFTGPSDVNGQRLITVTGANTFTFQASSLATAAGAFGAAGGLNNYTGNVFDATSATQAFFSTNATSQFTSNALSFTINTTTTGTVTFRYVASSPNSSSGQFNNLTNLAAAINEVNGLTARVVNGRLLVGSENASDAVTFANGDAAGSGTLGGLDWVSELDLANVAAGTNRFSTLQELADQVNASTGLSATVSNPLTATTVKIYNDDPLDTITFSDFVQTPARAVPNNSATVPATAAAANVDVVIADPGHPYQVGDNVVISGLTAGIGGLTPPLPNGTFQVVATAPGSYTFRIPGAQNPAGTAGAAATGGAAGTSASTNQGSILGELGIANSLNSGAYVRQTVGALGPAYDASGVVGQNMASGDITAQFSRNVRIYDALGSGHEVRMSFIKTATNTWAAEVHVIPTTDISTTLVDGQVATGTIQFNGDGSLRSVSNSLTDPITINWTNGAVPSTVTFDWGTAGQPFGTAGATVIGQTDGLTQFDSDYNVAFVNQNGAPVGELISVTIDGDGFVIASYSNGESQKLYKLAVADFNNPNGLNAITGNVYSQTQASGEVNLREAGTNGVGDVVSGSLESSNVELAEQLTDMIVAQRAYQANTRVITTTDQLLDELNRIVG